uniref:(California timema) hypothetical protein n=1 Tax=Timema californicum TaxID=61474 RepID=A0A7R9P6B0_TIMCA|nr:unnamed protein product [Timema californicum]
MKMSLTSFQTLCLKKKLGAARIEPGTSELALADDFNDPIHLEKLSTLNTFTVQDLGGVPKESLSLDYTSDYYRINEWYKKWLPDQVIGRHDTKTTYQVEIRYANNTNETFTFHGPPALSNLVEVGLNPSRNQVRCKQETDQGQNQQAWNMIWLVSSQLGSLRCEPIHGWGFRRGGYQCRCRPGFRLPTVVRTPFLGEILERATQEQHENGFDCQRIGWVHKMPVQWEKATPNMKEFYLEEFYEYKNYSVGAHSLHTQNMNIDQALKFILSVNAKTCKQFHPQDLILHGDIGYDAEQQFANEAKMAVRLANFISAFLQISDPKEVYSGKRVADKPLSEDQMIGETLALVLGDTKIWSAGTFWERNKFTNRTLFAPFAYKTQLNTRKFKVEDLARLNETSDPTQSPNSGTLGSSDSPQIQVLTCRRPNPRSPQNGQIDGEQSASIAGHTTLFSAAWPYSPLWNADTVYVCVPILGRGFEIGSYKCECLQGYEYPFEDPITYFDGQLVEAEFSNIVNDKPTRYDMFNCRLAGATSIQASYVTFLSLILLIRIVLR